MKYIKYITLIIFLFCLPFIFGIIGAENKLLQMIPNKINSDIENDEEENDTEIEKLINEAKMRYNSKEKKEFLEKYIDLELILDNIRVYNPQSRKVDRMKFEDYILGVLAAEMPATFEMEALKAQAVAARTYAVSKVNANVDSEYDVSLDYKTDQAYISKEDMRRNWKNEFDKKYNKIIEAVKKTSGEIMLYEGEPINAYFHSTSNGMTQNSGDVWSVNMPYLTPTYSDIDKTSPKYKSNAIFDAKKLAETFGDSKLENIEVLSRNNSDYVQEVRINSRIYSGIDVRHKLGLNSNSFNIIIEKNKENNEIEKVTFDVKGFGHGVGMSQYGANGMAKEGKMYIDILKHYYVGIDIIKLGV